MIDVQLEKNEILLHTNRGFPCYTGAYDNNTGKGIFRVGLESVAAAKIRPFSHPLVVVDGTYNWDSGITVNMRDRSAMSATGSVACGAIFDILNEDSKEKNDEMAKRIVDVFHTWKNM